MSIVQALIAASGRISAEYFLLPVAGLSHPIKRERVYCYELYHQLRLALCHSQLTLTGEPDKRGHPAFEHDKKLNPDFILHTPGVHGHNTAVVEVECRLQLKHLTKDLKNLKLMRTKGYSELVLLLFGAKQVPWERLKRAAAKAEIDLRDVVVLLHQMASEPATRQYPPAHNAA